MWASDAQSRTVENEWRMQECPPTIDSLAKAVGEFVLCKCQPGRGIIFINSKYPADQCSISCVTDHQSSMGKECNLRICRIMQNKQYTQHKLDGGGVKIQMVFREKITVKKLLEDWNSEKLAKIGLVGESDWM